MLTSIVKKGSFHSSTRSFIQHLFSTYISGSLCNFWQGDGTQIFTEAKTRKGEKGEEALARTWKGRDTLHKEKWRTERETAAHTWI